MTSTLAVGPRIRPSAYTQSITTTRQNPLADFPGERTHAWSDRLRAPPIRPHGLPRDLLAHAVIATDHLTTDPPAGMDLAVAQALTPNGSLSGSSDQTCRSLKYSISRRIHFPHANNCRALDVRPVIDPFPLDVVVRSIAHHHQMAPVARPSPLIPRPQLQRSSIRL